MKNWNWIDKLEITVHADNDEAMEMEIKGKADFNVTAKASVYPSINKMFGPERKHISASQNIRITEECAEDDAIGQVILEAVAVVLGRIEERVILLKRHVKAAEKGIRAEGLGVMAFSSNGTLMPDAPRTLGPEEGY